MTTDKKLLELAAKAVGYDTNHPMNTERCELAVPIDDLWVTCDGNLVSTGWNPLTDDGHALRLAVKLGIMVDNSDYVAYAISEGVSVAEKHVEDPLAATRRAIVRAAAAIGEKL